MKKLRILALMHPQLVPPDTLDGKTEEEINVWKTEYDVVSHLREIGHEVRVLGVQYELLPIRDAVEEWIAADIGHSAGRNGLGYGKRGRGYCHEYDHWAAN